MEFDSLIKKRYSVKSFTGEKISDEAFLKLKYAIRYTPSSFNWQPWKVKVVDNPEILKKLQEASWNQPQVGSASHLFVFCAMDDLTENNKNLLSKMKDAMPADKFETYKKMADGALSQMSEEDQVRMSERELFAAMENLLLSATDLGYGACPMGGFEADKYSEILEIPGNLTPIVVVPVGVASDEPREKFRFSEDEVFF